MKYGLMALMLFTILTSPFAQKQPALNRIYMESGTGPTNHNGFLASLGLRSAWKNNWTASFSYYYADMDPKGFPEDYEQGWTIVLIIPVPDVIPSADMSMINFSGGKLFELSKKFFVTTEAGISFVKGKTWSFTPQPVVSDIFSTSSNYASSQKSESAIGGIVRADISWALLRWLGISAGFYAGFNSIQSPIGGELKLIAGYMNYRKGKK